VLRHGNPHYRQRPARTGRSKGSRPSYSGSMRLRYWAAILVLLPLLVLAGVTAKGRWSEQRATGTSPTPSSAVSPSETHGSVPLPPGGMAGYIPPCRILPDPRGGSYGVSFDAEGNCPAR
jgi:hypothetical protein